MQYTTLGSSGLVVSRLDFGAMTFSTGNKDIGAIYKVGAQLADELVGHDNLGAADVTLTAAEVAALDAATQLAPVYPNWLYDRFVDEPIMQALGR